MDGLNLTPGGCKRREQMGTSSNGKQAQQAREAEARKYSNTLKKTLGPGWRYTNGVPVLR